MKQFGIYLFGVCIFIAIGWFGNTAYQIYQTKNPPIPTPKPTPLARYSIENLAKAQFKPSEIKIEGKNLFSFVVENKKVTGRITIPEGTGPFPVIVMFRGYVDPEIYYTGLGTKNTADYFTKNGFITIAPDFLGYGGSDHEADDIFETRFQTYLTAITLLKSIQNSSFLNHNSNIFIWGHSNGGQIALTTLEILGVSNPDLIGATVLWAPVSKPFPYSILYYTDEASDSGKFLRGKTAEFESNYDSDLFSLTKYLSNIKAPIQLNQGTLDDAVPVAWSNLLAKNLKEASVSADYIKYPGADHNMNPAWNQAVENALDFYKKHIQ